MTITPHDPVSTVPQRPLVTVASEDSLREAAERLSEELVGVGIVRDTEPQALLSERDVISGIAVGADPDTARVEYVMTDYVVTVGPGDSILDAANRMLMNEIRHLPVVEDGRVIGIVSERDLLRALTEYARATDR